MNRAGIALALALAVLLLVEVMTAGLLALTTHARMVASSQMRTARAQSAAHSAAHSVLNAWRAGTADTLAPNQLVTAASGNGTRDDLSFTATIERLAGATYVIRAQARAGGPGAYANARSVVAARTLDRAAVLAWFNHAAGGGGQVVIAGRSKVEADSAALPPAWSDSLCPPVEPLSEPAAIVAARPPLIGGMATVAGQFRLDSTLSLPDPLAVGGIRWSELAGIADRTERGLIAIGPAIQDTICDLTAAGNWGDPSDPAGPCGRYLPLVFSDGDLGIAAGRGQGILLVAGQLTVGPGVTFAGVILARDGVLVEPGANVHEVIDSTGGNALFDDAHVSYSRCAIARAVLLTPASRRLVVGQRRQIPAF